MIWNNVELKTIGDIAVAIAEVTTKEQAKELLMLFRQANEQADDIVVHILSRIQNEEIRQGKYDLFELKNPNIYQ